MAAPSRDTCRRGHPRTPDNMTSNRECRRCKTEANTLRMRAVREREQPKPKRHCSQGHDQAVHGSHSRGGWLGAIEGLPEVHVRLRTVQIECADWRRVLSAYDRADTFIYADPPYVLGTRRERRRGYVHELSDDDHGDLVGALLGCRSRVLLSAYDHPIYAPLAEAGWHRAEIAVSCHAAGRTRATRILGEGAARRLQPRTEIVWTNYDPQRLWGQLSIFSGVGGGRMTLIEQAIDEAAQRTLFDVAEVG